MKGETAGIRKILQKLAMPGRKAKNQARKTRLGGRESKKINTSETGGRQKNPKVATADT